MWRTLLCVGIVCCWLLNVMPARGQDKAGSSDSDEVPEIVLGQSMPEDHQELEKGMGCMECHRIKTDAVSTATELFLKQKGKISNDLVWQEIIKFFGHRRSCVLATNVNHESFVTTIDFALDHENKLFYALSEKGTRKLAQMKMNSNIALEFHNQTEWQKSIFRCLQMRGHARVFSSDDPQFDQGLKIFKPSKVDPEIIKRGMDMTCFTPSEILFYDVLRKDTGHNIFQLWER